MDKKTSLLDWVDRFPETEDIVRKYDKRVGVCILCSCLFDSIDCIEKTYNVDLSEMLKEMQAVSTDKGTGTC